MSQLLKLPGVNFQTRNFVSWLLNCWQLEIGQGGVFTSLKQASTTNHCSSSFSFWRVSFPAHPLCMYLGEGEYGKRGRAYIFLLPLERLRTLEVNKIEKRENSTIRQCEVTSDRGKLWLWVCSTWRIHIQLVKKDVRVDLNLTLKGWQDFSLWSYRKEGGVGAVTPYKRKDKWTVPGAGKEAWNWPISFGWSGHIWGLMVG